MIIFFQSQNVALNCCMLLLNSRSSLSKKKFKTSNFANQNTFLVILTYQMVDQLSQEIIEELKEAFKVFDPKGTGFISTKQLGTLMRSLGQNPSELEIQNFLNTLVENCETIDFSIFLSFIAPILKEELDHQDEVFIEALNVYDKEGKGFIDIGDLRCLMKNVEEKTEEEMEFIIKTLDVNRDGKVNIREFVRIMMNEKED